MSSYYLGKKKYAMGRYVSPRPSRFVTRSSMGWFGFPDIVEGTAQAAADEAAAYDDALAWRTSTPISRQWKQVRCTKPRLLQWKIRSRQRHPSN